MTALIELRVRPRLDMEAAKVLVIIRPKRPCGIQARRKFGIRKSSGQAVIEKGLPGLLYITAHGYYDKQVDAQDSPIVGCIEPIPEKESY